MAGNAYDALFGSVLVYDRNGSLLWQHTLPMDPDFEYTGHYAGAQSVAISDDYKYIAVAYADSTLRVFELSP